VPVQAENRGADGLLDVFAHPPVVVLLKVADTDAARARGNCKFVLFRGPSDKSSGAIDAQ